MQTAQERVRATGPPQDPFPPTLLWAGRTLPTCPRGPRKPGSGFSERILQEERGGARRKTRAGSTREPDGAAPPPQTPARVAGPGREWTACVGHTHREGRGGVRPGLAAGARGLRSGAQVTCEEGRKSPKRGACCELGVLGAPRAAGARAPGRAGDAAGTRSQTEGAAVGVGGTATEKDTAGRGGGVGRG